MDPALENIWDEPLAEASPKRTTETNNNDDDPAQRPTKRPRQALFLLSSDDEDAAPANARKAPPPEDIDIDAFFADIEQDDVMGNTEVPAALDASALRRQAEARYKNALPPLTPHQVLPSSSPPRDFGDDDGKSKKEKKGAAEKKERVRLIKLDENRLLGPNGFPALIKSTKDFKIKGKGHEAADLNRLLQVYQFWTHQLYPKTQFRDTAERVEKLCHSRRMHVALSVWRDEAHGKARRAESDAEDGDNEAEANDDMNVDDENERPATSRPASSLSSRPPSSLGYSDGDAEPRPSTSEPRPLTDDEAESQAFWDSLDNFDAEALSAPSVPPTTPGDDDMDWDVLNEMGAPSAHEAAMAAPSNPTTIQKPPAEPTAPVVPANNDGIVPEPPGNILDELDDWDDMYV